MKSDVQFDFSYRVGPQAGASPDSCTTRDGINEVVVRCARLAF
jgi:hypothetical protein